jgi:hypothetical protein
MPRSSYLYPENGGSMFLWNIGSSLPAYVVSLSRTSQYKHGTIFPTAATHVKEKRVYLLQILSGTVSNVVKIKSSILKNECLP